MRLESDQHQEKAGYPFSVPIPMQGRGRKRAFRFGEWGNNIKEKEFEVLTSLLKKYFVKIMQFEKSISEMDPEEIKGIIDRS